MLFPILIQFNTYAWNYVQRIFHVKIIQLARYAQVGLFSYFTQSYMLKMIIVTGYLSVGIFYEKERKKFEDYPVVILNVTVASVLFNM